MIFDLHQGGLLQEERLRYEMSVRSLEEKMIFDLHQGGLLQEERLRYKISVIAEKSFHHLLEKSWLEILKNIPDQRVFRWEEGYVMPMISEKSLHHLLEESLLESLKTTTIPDQGVLIWKEGLRSKISVIPESLY